jgi:hypothetical protein
MEKKGMGWRRSISSLNGRRGRLLEDDKVPDKVPRGGGMGEDEEKKT